MGIYSGMIHDISNTQIYVSPSVNPYSSRQLVVYSTTIEFQYGPAFLCLPVPHPETLQFHSIKTDCSFFDSLERSFAPLPRYGPVDPVPLVPTASFLNPRVFCSLASLRATCDDENLLDSKVLAQLEEIYKDLAMGFLLIELTPGRFRYAPLAYSHAMLHGRVFVPTLMYRARHPKDSCVQVNTHLWNHTLYRNGSIPSFRDRYRIRPQPRIHEILWRQLPPEFQTPLVELVREKKEGFFENYDLSYKIHRNSEDRPHRSVYAYPRPPLPPPPPFLV